MRRIYIKRNRRGFLGIGVLVVVICGVLYYNSITTDARVRANKEVLDSLTKTKEQLLKEQDELKKEHEVSYEEIEQIAREKLDLVYEDEIILTPNN